MNWDYFNTLGYLSVILWIAMPLLWIIQSRMKPRRWWVHIALVLGLVAYALAEMNSKHHVERIRADQSEQLAQQQAEKEAKLQAAMDMREEDVANIQFAEDDADDFYDRAGMDESELKFIDKVNEDVEPAWKREKKTRGAGGGEDADLEDMIGAKEETEGLVSEELENAKEPEPIIMSAKDMEMANRLDSMNLKTIRVMILLAVFFLVVDYLRRANVYREAYLPMPLPGPWVNAATPHAAVVERPQRARRSMVDELAWITKRGDAFLYLTDDKSKASQLPDTMPKMGRKCCPTELINVSDEKSQLKSEFVFESLWYARASFIVDSTSVAKALLSDFEDLLKKRKASRARTRRTVHIVWDMSEPIPETTKTSLVDLAEAAGFSLFLNHSQPHPQS